jgi:pyruvate dehydrogenase E1 component alpha subunit
MFRIRRFEEHVMEFMDKAEMVGGAHLSLGQEAAIVGACMTLRDDDYMVGTHRSHGHPLGKGAPIKPLMAELLGRRTGINKGKGGSMHLADFRIGSLGETSIVASGLPIAVGGGLSAKLRGTDQVALAFFGDGAVQEGAFHESLNLAAVWNLPVIFYCENNQYAMTTPFTDSSAVPNVADRAAAYAMPGKIVDGQDVLACWRVTQEAVARARSGNGPSLIEAKTHRYQAHSYRVRESRPPEEIELGRRRDPLALFQAQLIGSGVVSDADLAAVQAAVEEEISEGIKFARASEVPEPGEAFTDLYAGDIPVAQGDPRW